MADPNNVIVLSAGRRPGRAAAIASQCSGTLRLMAEGADVSRDAARTAAAWALRELQLLRKHQELSEARTSMACQRVWLATQRRAVNISDLADHLVTAHEELVEAHHVVSVLQDAHAAQQAVVR